ncbi:MAG: riboflavin synthase [Lentisphaerota bacterium]
MFTGLIQQTGKLEEIRQGAGGGALYLRSASWPSPIVLGESIAVQGVCLTAVREDAGIIQFDVLLETLAKTNLGMKKRGDSLNLERALRAGDAMGGHLVSGHVDGMGRIREMRPAGRDWVVVVECSAELIQGIVPKGSIALDGISLTVVEVGDASFSVHIIPHTWEQTSLSSLRVGDAVNLETDLLGKYVAKYLGANVPGHALTWEKLRQSGFMEA